MSLFSVRRPRGFRHRYIYYDERKERLKAMEQRARHDLGIDPPEAFRPEDLRGVFSDSAKHLSRARRHNAAGKWRMHYGVLVFAIVALVFLIRCLLAG